MPAGAIASINTIVSAVLDNGDLIFFPNIAGSFTSLKTLRNKLIVPITSQTHLYTSQKHKDQTLAGKA